MRASDLVFYDANSIGLWIEFYLLILYLTQLSSAWDSASDPAGPPGSPQSLHACVSASRQEVGTSASPCPECPLLRARERRPCPLSSRASQKQRGRRALQRHGGCGTLQKHRGCWVLKNRGRQSLQKHRGCWAPKSKEGARPSKSMEGMVPSKSMEGATPFKSMEGVGLN